VAELNPELGSPSWVLGNEYEELFSILTFWRRKGKDDEYMFWGSGYRGKSESSFSLMWLSILYVCVARETIVIRLEGGDGWLLSWVRATIADFSSEKNPRCVEACSQGRTP
jgi:hypothetical protein